MKFVSTLGGGVPVSFESAVLTGFTEDGGILMPETIPVISSDDLKNWAHLSYVDIVKNVAALFATEEDIPKKDLDNLIDSGFSSFDEKTIAPITNLSEDLSVMELFHGKTLAFKDYALCCLTQFMNYFLEKRNKRSVILVATSGDTGGAALEAVRNLSSLRLIVLFPRGRISSIQELQMTTANVDNALCIKASGTSDDLDVPLKTIITEDVEFARKFNICSINSINFGRLLVQIAHFVYAYLHASQKDKRPVEIIVPSGALGNITSGCIARAMGVPIRLVLSTNSNDICHKLVQTGSAVVSKEVIQSFSSAMDIQLPYNLSRILWLFSNKDTKNVKQLITDLETNGTITVPTDIMTNLRQTIVDSSSVNDEVSLLTMHQCWDKYNYLICPHTACGMAYCFQRAESSSAYHRIVIATASPEKFPEAVKAAPGDLPLPNPPSSKLSSLLNKEKVFIDLDSTSDIVAFLRQRIPLLYAGN